MRTLYLPVEHTDEDLAIASELAELLDSAELFVAWDGAQYELPGVTAEVHFVAEPAAAATRRPRRHRNLLRALAAAVRAR